jgi:hypothetical protein
MNMHADRQARELSQKHVLKKHKTAAGDEVEVKLPALLDLTICEARPRPSRHACPTATLPLM